MSELHTVAHKMVEKGKGILAADESTSTCTKRFASINTDSTAESRNFYRNMLFTTEDIEKYIGDITIYSNKESYPGSFKSHYSPSKKLYLGDIKMLTDKFKDKRIGVLCFDKYYDFIKEKNQILLSKNSSLFEASKNLYSSLYKLDNMKNIDIILSSLVEDTLIGRTINNRLTKSAEDNDEN